MTATRSQLIRLLSAEVRDAEAAGNEQRVFKLLQHIDEIACGGSLHEHVSLELASLGIRSNGPGLDNPSWGHAA